MSYFGHAFDVTFSILITLSIILNGLVIAALLKIRNHLTTQSVLLLFATILDFLQSIIGYPLEIGAKFYEADTKCLIAGFATTALSLMSLSLITVMAIVRLLCVKHPIKMFIFMKNWSSSLYFIIPSILYGLFWGILPLIGWSNYVPENTTRCSINLQESSADATSYVYTLLVFCYIVPILIMMYSFHQIRKALLQRIETDSSSATQEPFRKQRKWLKLLIVMVLTFLASWTPYAVAVFLLAEGISVSPTILDIAALCGKSSTIYNPIIYAILYKQFQIGVRALFGCSYQQGLLSTTIADNRNSETEMKASRGSEPN